MMLGNPVAVGVPPSGNIIDGHWLAGRVDLVQELEEALAIELGQRFADGEPDDLAPANERAIRRAGRAEDVLRSGIDGHGARKLGDDTRELDLRGLVVTLV
jgi:hypothetical protein